VVIIGAGAAAAVAVVAMLLGVGLMREAGPGTAGRRRGAALTAAGATVVLVFAAVWAAWIVLDLAG